MARRRGKYKPEVAAKQQDAVIESLFAGCSRVGACRAAKLPRRTFYNWLRDDEAFAAAVELAQEGAVASMESVVYVAGLKAEDDPRFLRAAIRWLERHGGWRRGSLSPELDLRLFTDEELERIVDGEDPACVLLSSRAAEGAGGW